MIKKKSIQIGKAVVIGRKIKEIKGWRRNKGKAMKKVSNVEIMTKCTDI